MSGERKIDRSFCKHIDQVEAQAEIDRLLADPLFQSPERNRSFLRFIAAEFFEGRAEAVKAYAIAVDVFGRPANFNPAVDPIVRIEATRLRAALTQYYDVHGSDTGIRVDLPRGRYVPVFTRIAPNEVPGPPVETPVPDRPDPMPAMEAMPAHRFRGANIAFALVVLLAITGLAAYALTLGLDLWKQGALKEKPLVSIVLSSDGDMPQREIEKLQDYLTVAISQFQTVRLAPSGDQQVKAPLSERMALALRGWRAADDYRITLKYEGRGVQGLVWWQAADASSGEVLLSGIEKALLPDAAAFSVGQGLANRLASTLAGTRGAINTLETLHELDAPSLGNGCILRAISAGDRGDEAAISDARGCLEQTLAIAPNDAGAKAELAIILLAQDPVEAPTGRAARAHQLAADAAQLSPFSDRSKYALMISQFRAGQIEAAVETGHAALALNPNNSDIAARLGLYLFITGRWEEGAGLAVRSMQMDHYLASDGLLTRALNAYRLGRFDDAFALSQQLKVSGDYAVQAVQAAAAGQLGKADEVRLALAGLGAGLDGFDAAFRKNMGARYFTPEMIGLLETGIMKAAASNL